MKLFFSGVALVLVLSLSGCSLVKADCCSRKGDFGCCGNGGCNIFCCNCDGGCNDMCERTSCNTADWIACGAIVTGCSAACVVTEGEACVQCMGPLYDQCKGCYSTTTKDNLLAPNRDVFFSKVAGQDGIITEQDVANFIGNKALKLKNTLLSTPSPQTYIVGAYDENRSGDITRLEFDNDKVDISFAASNDKVDIVASALTVDRVAKRSKGMRSAV